MMRLGVLAGLLLGLPLAAEAATPAPTLTLTPCRLKHPARMLALTAECGSFTVAENPDQPNGRKIDLFVARVPAISIKKAPDPLFLIAGGPGTSAVDLYTSSAPPFDRVRRDRDIVLVDQRGTGRSNRLDCKYGSDNLFERFDDVEVGPENVRCRDDLSKRADLRMYTTSIAVRDLDAVRVALGYERINLYGGSYGTRVAQHYARRYPKSTRTLILDGVVNPEQVLGPGIALDAEHALERILKRCKDNASCAKAFSDPVADYHQLRTHLAANPWPATVSEASTGRPIHFEFTERHLSAVRIRGVGEVVVPARVRAERRVVARRGERQGRAAAPAADQLRGEQFPLLLGLRVLVQEPVERPDARLVVAQPDEGAVAAQHVRCRHRQRHAGLAGVAEDEFASLDRSSLAG